MCGDLLRGASNHDLRYLRLPRDLRRREAGRARNTADGHQHFVAGNEALGGVHGLFGLAGIVRIYDFDLLAEQAAGGVLFLHGKIDRILLALSHGRRVTRQWAEDAELHGISQHNLGGTDTEESG